MYVDYNATAPIRPEIREAVEPLLFSGQDFGNPSSVHWAGQVARRHLERARGSVAAQFGVKPSEVLFTSGGTEADNLALFGVMLSPSEAPRRLVVSAVEHPAVLEPARELRRLGVDVEFVPVTPEGHLDLGVLRRALETPTRLVSIMAVNNETGVVHDIETVAQLAHDSGAWVMVDAVQAVGRVALPADLDLVVVSGHKLGGLKGAGALIKREHVPLRAEVFGGPQERGVRAGTEDVAAVASLAWAIELAEATRASENRRLEPMRDRLQAGLTAMGGVHVIGCDAPRIAGTTTMVFDDIDGDALLQALDLEGIAASSGSACSSGSLEPSHVLSAMGIPQDRALASVRFSLGWASTEDDIQRILDVTPALLARLRASP